MKSFYLWMGVITLACVAFACGAKVVVDTGAAGHTGSGGSAANACPSSPHDTDIEALVGKPCTTAEQVCVSNDLCSACSITCTNGMWTATGAQLCTQAGPTC